MEGAVVDDFQHDLAELTAPAHEIIPHSEIERGRVVLRRAGGRVHDQAPFLNRRLDVTIAEDHPATSCLTSASSMSRFSPSGWAGWGRTICARPRDVRTRETASHAGTGRFRSGVPWMPATSRSSTNSC